MQKSMVIMTFVLCIAMMVFAGCTGSGASSAFPTSTPALSGGSSGGTRQVFPCSIGAPVDVSKSSVLEIITAEGQGEVRDIFYIRGKIRNKAGEGTYSAVAGRSCDLLTGKCITDKVGVIFKPYETVDYTLVTGGGCPASGTAATCTCEAWIDIMR
ncbi:MAG: hypothetical protein LUO98_01360 [Methanoregula sp.]|nr:hypothetical protein [Methanoregula sp.]